MEGTIKQNGNDYWWWAGPANDGAREGYCVHCRNEAFGVTEYINSEPDEASAEHTAKALVAKVESISS